LQAERLRLLPESEAVMQPSLWRHARAWGCLLLWWILTFGVLMGMARAVEPGETLADPALEARARAITAELRCLVCQNQSIDDSNAPLAHDLRVLVRERLKDGDSDEAVMAFVVARYGDYVRLKPPFKPKTFFLWLGPFLVLALGTAIALRAFRPRLAGDVPPLASREEDALSRALDHLDEQGQ
jgi:cytochrome c-type biogenesis protein CcmH